MKSLPLAAVALACIAAGFAIGQVTATQPAAPKKVTGIGGVFFKAKDPASLKAWYAKNLGLPIGKYGVSFDWLESDGVHKAKTQWMAFPEKTKYFEPSEKAFMINYRVANLTWLLEELKKEGIEPAGPVQRESYGAFAHILDPEGNKIELWEDTQNDKPAK